jgi:hypothetical protein
VRYFESLTSLVVSAIATAQAQYDNTMASLAWYYSNNALLSQFLVPHFVMSSASAEMTVAVGTTIPTPAVIEQFYTQFPTVVSSYVARNALAPTSPLLTVDVCSPCPPVVAGLNAGFYCFFLALQWVGAAQGSVTLFRQLSRNALNDLDVILSTFQGQVRAQLTQFVTNAADFSRADTALSAYLQGLVPVFNSLRLSTLQVKDVLVTQADLKVRGGCRFKMAVSR